MNAVRKSLEEAGVKVLSAEATMIPDNYVNPTAEQQATLERMFDMLDENDDVQNVYHNAVLED